MLIVQWPVAITKRTKVKYPAHHKITKLKTPLLESLKTFLVEYCHQDDDHGKVFKYSSQLTKLAHREQIAMYIELDDVYDYDDELAMAIINNTRRYVNMAGDVIAELLPTFKEHDVIAKDALDVYIEHRLMMEGRLRQPNDPKKEESKFPSELMRRL